MCVAADRADETGDGFRSLPAALPSPGRNSRLSDRPTAALNGDGPHNGTFPIQGRSRPDNHLSLSQSGLGNKKRPSRLTPRGWPFMTMRNLHPFGSPAVRAPDGDCPAVWDRPLSAAGSLALRPSRCSERFAFSRMSAAPMISTAPRDHLRHSGKMFRPGLARKHTLAERRTPWNRGGAVCHGVASPKTGGAERNRNVKSGLQRKKPMKQPPRGERGARNALLRALCVVVSPLSAVPSAFPFSLFSASPRLRLSRKRGCQEAARGVQKICTSKKRPPA